MFTKSESNNFRLLIEGVSMRPLAFGEKTNLCEFRLLKGSRLPAHQHPYEQTGYLASGRLNFRIGNDWYAAKPGDSWSVSENVMHEVEVLEDSIVFELFSPLRPDYLPDQKKD
jgi:quercetin dioxygenase-like cupin family protein